MKHFIKLLFLFSVIFLAENTYASSGGSSSGSAVTQTLFNSQNPLKDNLLTNAVQDLANSTSPANITDYINGAPVYSTIFPESMAAFLCDIRRLFCGKLTVAIVGVAVFISGLLILNGRMTWTWGMIIIVCSILLLRAESATDYILQYSVHIPGGLNLNLDLSIMNQVCMCFPTLPGINNTNGCGPLSGPGGWVSCQ